MHQVWIELKDQGHQRRFILGEADDVSQGPRVSQCSGVNARPIQMVRQLILIDQNGLVSRLESQGRFPTIGRPALSCCGPRRT